MTIRSKFLTSRELAAKCFDYKNKYPLLGERFGEPLTLYETLLKRKTFQGGKFNNGERTSTFGWLKAHSFLEGILSFLWVLRSKEENLGIL
jgi:hypothetical protein